MLVGIQADDLTGACDTGAPFAARGQETLVIVSDGDGLPAMPRARSSVLVVDTESRMLPVEEARISPFDRGFLYSDGVYEVMPVYAGRPFRFEAHRERLTRSLAEIFMRDPHSPEEWRAIIANLITANGGGDQYVYWQVTRGAEKGRNHAPLPDIPRTVFAFCAPFPVWPPGVAENGVACVTARA